MFSHDYTGFAVQDDMKPLANFSAIADYHSVLQVTERVIDVMWVQRSFLHLMLKA